jgi:hypothetical protein
MSPSDLCVLGLNHRSYNLGQYCLHSAIHHEIRGQYIRVEATGATPVQRVRECILVVADSFIVVERYAYFECEYSSDYAAVPARANIAAVVRIRRCKRNDDCRLSEPDRR